MATIDQVKNGFRQYVDQQILPHLSGASRFGAAVYLQLALNSIDGKIQDYKSKASIKLAGVFTQDGQIDIDNMYKAAVGQLGPGDKIDLDIPVIGHVLFSRNDLQKLYNLIRRA